MKLSVYLVSFKYPLSKIDLRSRVVTHPLRTPSTCKSTHHTPGIPSISHSAAYLIAWPTGIHSKKQKYRKETPSRNGSRVRKRVMDTGVHRKLAGAGGTGRKGAIAVPMVFL